MKIIIAVRLSILATALVVLDACSSTPQPLPVGSAKIIYKKGLPGGVFVQTVKVTAPVIAVDQAGRTMTLGRPGGKKLTVKVAPGAINFPQIRAGDQIDVTVTQEVIVSLNDKEAASGTPAGENSQTTATVTAVDLPSRMVTLLFENGTTEHLPVRSDVDLSKHKAGEQLTFRVTDITAYWVEKLQ